MPVAIRSLVLGLLGALMLAAPAHAIVGGTETTRDWPHMAAMEFLDDYDEDGDREWGFRCGGSLVRADVVLSAAHCVDGADSEPQRFRFLLGTRDRASGGERIEVVRVVEHPEWDSGGKDSHDVAMLKLGRPSALGAPIRIAGSSDAQNFQPGDPAIIIGWGATFSGGPATRTLREAELPIRSDSECAQNYTVTASFDAGSSICAGNLEGGEDTCQGDSGGPLMVPGADGRFVLVGDTSFGVGCAFPTQYGVYGEVAGAVLRPWAEARANELTSGAPAPAPGAGGGGGSTAPGAGDGQAVVPGRVRLTLPRRLGSARRARSRRRLAVTVRSTGAVRGLRVTLRQRGRIVAGGRRARLRRRGGVTLRLRSRLRAGRATLVVTARDARGRTVRAKRVVRVRD